MMDMKKRVALLAVCVLLASLLTLGVLYAASVTVDDFSVGFQYHCEPFHPVFCTAGPYGSVASTSALGGRRDISLTILTGSSLTFLSANGTSPNEVELSVPSGVTAIGEVVWDGDNDATTLDSSGLGGVDLSDGGTNIGILVSVLFDDRAIDVTLEVFSSTNVATYTINLPGGLDGLSNQMDVFVPFADFNGNTTVFTSAGAVRLSFAGASAVDANFDQIAATTIREYGDLPTSTYGARTLDAYHYPQGLRLGNNADGEVSPNQSAYAGGDDGNGYDDEDGAVANISSWSDGTNGGTITVTFEGCGLIGTCYINGWIDWDNDGYFTGTVAGASEHVINNVSRSADRDQSNPEAFTFDTPNNWTSSGAGDYFARFRICEGSTDCDDPGIVDTNVSNGEIEDHSWEYHPTAVRLASFSASPAGTAVRLEWKTATELDNRGFHLYRSGSLDGPYVRLNEALIPGQDPGSVLGATYTWLDGGTKPGVTYYYKLETVDIHDKRAFYGPKGVALLASQTHVFYLPVVTRNW